MHNKVISFTKSKLPYGWLGNMSPYPIEFNGEIWRTAEALFQALRFTDPEIQQLIREEKSPMGAKFAAKARVEQMVCEPLGEKDLINMKMCIRLKALQHEYVKTELLATEDAIIVEDVTSRGDKGNNLFWGMMLVDGEWVGQNTLGKMWMELREQLKTQ